MPRLAAFNFGARKFGFGSLFSSAAATEANYIEDVFSTYLYTGTGANQIITNGIDLSTKGGMVWIKDRVWIYGNPEIFDTARGVYKLLTSAGTNTEVSISTTLTAFNSNGFSLGSDASGYGVNRNGDATVSWTFREQPKFFDVVTFTATRSGAGWVGGPQVINHALGSTPGMIVVKVASGTTSPWRVYHRSLGGNYRINLNDTDAAVNAGSTIISVSSTTFTLENAYAGFIGDGITATFVAYLFAHNAGGFGLTGSDNVISCGSFTTDGSGNATVSLGYEPQWLMYKCSSSTGDWEMVDVMRGWVVGVNNDNGLRANSADAEAANSNRGEPNSTGFNCVSFPINRDWIYIAIRRGPMKVPTSGTSVYNSTGLAAPVPSFKSNFTTDFAIETNRSYTDDRRAFARLTGNQKLITNSTAAQATDTNAAFAFDTQTGWGTVASTDSNERAWMFARAPGFFDVVCYTGTGSATTFNHNLGVAPELMIVKSRSSSVYDWRAYSATLGATQYLTPNTTQSGAASSTSWNDTAPTASVFTVGSSVVVNGSGGTYVAYLFATCAGVSKVGSYTGTGALQTVNCGFTGGARFVLIKRTDSTGDWYVYDTARGIIAGNDPYLLLNSTAAEVTNTDYIDPVASGFELSSTAPAAINANGGTYIFLAIA